MATVHLNDTSVRTRSRCKQEIKSTAGEEHLEPRDRALQRFLMSTVLIHGEHRERDHGLRKDERRGRERLRQQGLRSDGQRNCHEFEGSI